MENKQVDVVLTAYKRPDTLLRQIHAIRNQTYKVNKLYLFQDGINSYYEIKFKEDFLKQFDDVNISKENKGVWARFEYAYQVCKSKFVCIFDDDTIPGDQWIENCINSSEVRAGIYGTNGIIVHEAAHYPNRMTNVGWHNPNTKAIQVDFVGHAWFLETKWIGWMLDKRTKYNYKYVGEDMALSFSCLENGIPTFVPPHPYNNLQLWGSKPKIGQVLGVGETALSFNPDNLSNMKKALMEMNQDGWIFLKEINRNYLEIIESSFETKESKKKTIENDLLGEAFSCKKIFLYGAGIYGAEFYTYLKNRNIDIAGFVLSEKHSDYTQVNGENYKVYSVEEINEMKNAFIVLSLSEGNHEGIRRKLASSITVFPKVETTYYYQDILDLLKNELEKGKQ